MEEAAASVVEPAKKRLETRAGACTYFPKRQSNSGHYCCRQDVSHRVHLRFYHSNVPCVFHLLHCHRPIHCYLIRRQGHGLRVIWVGLIGRDWACTTRSHTSRVFTKPYQLITPQKVADGTYCSRRWSSSCLASL